ncbi:MAG: adenosylcobinamide-GDP ribazoletransferase [Methanobacterium sp.]|uniref:adenosylcobinamide-GDP ribazoletransferase n=1 Tax=Methanobacterium sp. TaxID=2164 RepID=UPI003C74FD1D
MSDSPELNDENKEVRNINGFFGLISFSTILPLNIHTTIEEMALFTWIWPIIGGLIGIIVGTFGFLIVDLFHLPILIAAALIYSFSIWFTGFHHLDGLIDFGDGMMVHGSPEKKIAVMRDKRIGTGGIAYLLMVGLITFAAIGSTPLILIFYVLVISEIAAKMGIVTCATFSKAFPDGTGRPFIESMNKKKLLISFIISLALGFLIFNSTGIIGVTMGLLSGAIIAFVSKKSFIWATGDILGTSNEIARMLALVAMVTLLLI